MIVRPNQAAKASRAAVAREVQGHTPAEAPEAGYHSNAGRAAGPGLRRVNGPAPKTSRRGAAIETQYLLHRVGDGDETAVAECIDRFGGLVWSLARRVGLPDAEAEDAVQEVFTAVWSNAAKYDPSIASETAFVAMIARRRLIDRRRKVGRQPARQQISEELDAAPPARAPQAEISEEASRAAEALTRLSPDQQRVLRLSVYEGLSHELISRATGFPLGTVKTHARRGLIKLRELLREQGEGEDANGVGMQPRKEGAL